MTMKSVVFFAIAIVSAYGAPRELLQSRIIGGNFSAVNEFPFMVSIQTRGLLPSSWSHACGGSIIAGSWVLTNAPCLSGLANLANARVVAGDLNLLDTSGDEQLRSVDSWIPHPDFDANSYANDIALIKVSGIPFVLTGSAVRAVPLPSIQDQEYGSGIPVTVTGWGQIADGGSNVNDMRKAQVFLVSDNECRKTYGNSTIKDSMICAGLPDGGADPCNGDYGGPLFIGGNGNFLQVGIASWDQDCASATYPAVYTQVSYYIDWINSYVNGTA